MKKPPMWHKGQPLFDFLKTVGLTDEIHIDNNDGLGFFGRVNQIPWYMQDYELTSYECGKDVSNQSYHKITIRKIA